MLSQKLQLTKQNRKVLAALLTLFLVTSGLSAYIAYNAGVKAQTTNQIPTTNTMTGGQYPGATAYTVYPDGGIYYAKNAYGATSSSSSASTIIQEALNSLTAGRTSKETILLKGTFTLTSQITVPSYTKIIVDGSIKLGDSFSSSTIQLFLISAVSNVEITGGDWNGNGANQAANNEYISGIYISGSTDISLSYMNVHDWGYTTTYGWGINAGYGSQRITIDHITGYNNGNEVIALNDASDSIATNLILYNNAKFDAGANGIWINSNNVTISHVVGWGHKWGTVRVEANDKDRHGIILSDIVTHDNSKIGISIDKTAVGNWHLYDVTLDDFSVTNTASFEGVFVWGQAAGQVYDITVSNGHVYNTVADSGVYLYNVANSTISNVDVKDSYGNGISIVSCDNIKILGGNLAHNGLSGLYYDSDITFSSVTNSKVIGATLTDSPAYGFREDASCSKNIIDTVTATGNAVGIMILTTSGSVVSNSLNGTTRVYSSDIYNGIGHTSSSTYVVISFPHDLGYTPTMVTVTMADFGYGYYWVNATSSTSFRLNVQTSGTYYFLWEAR